MFRAGFSVLVICIAMSATGWGQAKEQMEQGMVEAPQAVKHMRAGFTQESIAILQTKMRNVERQDRLVSDTNKLVALVSNFNQQANKNDLEISSAEMAKRAAEIEKLARSVKERMRDSY